MRPRRKIHQLKPIPATDDPVPMNTDSTPMNNDSTPMNNDSVMTETKSAALASSPPPPSPPHPPPSLSQSSHPLPPLSESSQVYSRFAYLCLDPTYMPNPYTRNLRWAYFLEESTATLHVAQVTIDYVGTTNFKLTVAGNMEPAAPEIVQRYASIVYTGSIYRQAYFPSQIPMVEAPVYATSSSSAYVPPSTNPNHNSTPV